MLSVMDWSRAGCTGSADMQHATVQASLMMHDDILRAQMADKTVAYCGESVLERKDWPSIYLAHNELNT